MRSAKIAVAFVAVAIVMTAGVGSIAAGDSISSQTLNDRVLDATTNNSNTTASLTVDSDNTTAEELVLSNVNYTDGNNSNYFVVVENEDNETIGESSELNGSESNVTVTFDNPIGSNTTVTASIYTSDNGSLGSDVGGSEAETDFDIDVAAGGGSGNDLPIVGDLPFIGEQSTVAAVLIVLGLLVFLVGGAYFIYREMQEEDMG